ncbi:hypothetical protein COCSUDRAFT_31953 [Coccomyxa subellipsoidea C-169]|uniref:Uncharacterized protein n=1 Tax=Coccomyxa subellipsoidea (strain C-169) TaxID=574566 RepID=I0Z9A8_COCSC|nr:hypothetical protein COCSUDRAFT_31953 [Coccomyxa subellipsoidea C-169]EIE27227.1 hypothetical protein COCSUDRAFT_31953 [Coccomyxa subellipsoidea C-169]|eukprot:XP_005651771.1 hypothetical protein COCSUDRAFT_31953 [Coccomyxa subellipsoidea C-169]
MGPTHQGLAIPYNGLSHKLCSHIKNLWDLMHKITLVTSTAKCHCMYMYTPLHFANLALQNL